MFDWSVMIACVTRQGVDMLRFNLNPGKHKVFFHSNGCQDVLYEVFQSVTRIANQGGQVKVLWVPAHVGVRGNERMDELAKRALKKGNIEMQIDVSKAEVKCVIWEKKQMWQ